MPTAPTFGRRSGGDPSADLLQFSQFNRHRPMTYTVTRLPRRNPRADELWQRQGQRGRGASVGQVRRGDGDESVTVRGRGQGSGDRCVGRGVTLNPVGGMGRVMVADLESTITNAKAQHRADRIAAARDRLADRVEHSDLAVRF